MIKVQWFLRIIRFYLQVIIFIFLKQEVQKTTQSNCFDKRLFLATQLWMHFVFEELTWCVLGGAEA